ncbi:MAG: hypothetical protein LIP12_08575 [Clostridiales bacterium]|nr:hypothetical protein [Clostridiales bacterium]
MLNQLIYTRCFPHRDLKNQGQVNRSGGFGIFSLSRELFADGEAPSPDLLQRVLAVRSGSRESSEAGVFSVYEYTRLSENTYALSREETRTRFAEGSTGQRSGGFIKQCFTGEFAGRPCAWFGADEWDAYKRPESDYYLEQDEDQDQEPEWLPQADDEPMGGYLDLVHVKSFVRDGRTEAVKAALWFLLHEYDKPEEERKVLLIRDTPENVELWVAAIEYALPEALAGTVTFVTNRSNLMAQINSELFYYVDDTGRFSPVGNSGGALKRRPYCMITGFHPQDEFCGALALTSTDRYGLIDGVGKAACFQPQDTIKEPFYTAAVSYGKKIKEFYTDVFPSLNIPQAGTLLERAYNAWDYLFSEEPSRGERTYYTFCSAVEALREAGLSAGEPSSPARELSGKLLEECIHVYPRFMEEDEDGGYALLALMWEMARELNCPERVSICLAERLSRECENLVLGGARLGKTWAALKNSSLTDMVMPALVELFDDERIVGYTPLLEDTPPATAAMVLDLFFTMEEAEPRGLRQIGDSDEKYRFVCLALAALQKDRQELEKALVRLQTSPKLFYAVISSVSEYLEKTDARGRAKGEYPDRASDWWDAVLELYDGNIGTLCETLYQQRDQLSGDVEDVFFRRLDALLNPWHCAESRKGVRNVLSETYAKMKRWASACGRTSVSVSFYEFRDGLRRAQSAAEALSLADAFAGKCFHTDHLFVGSAYFQALAAAAARFGSEDLHFTMACLFAMPDARMLTAYIDAYVSEALSLAKGHRLAAQVVSLAGASLYMRSVPGRSAEFTQDARHMLEQALRRYLPQYYTPKLAGKVLAEENCTGELQQKLMALLKEAGQSYQPSVPERIAGKVLGWRNRKN